MKEVVERINLIHYINWLEQFTEIENSFYDDSYLYRKMDEVKKLERGNAAKLELFYKELDRFLKQENMKPIKDDYQTYYPINYHDNYFEIGFMIGPETVYFCRRITPKEQLPIDFSQLEKSYVKKYN